MFRCSHLLSFGAALGIVAAASAQHSHMTVDTAPTIDGDQVQIVAGYLPAESAYSIADHRLLKDGLTAVYVLPDQLQAGPLAGWYAGFELLLTSDYYYITGRLDGGDFMWELAEIVNCDGGPGADAAWGSFGGGGSFNPLAISTAATRAGRSYDTFAGGHEHNQGYAFSGPGLFDLTFIVWDRNGVYPVDSEPVKVRFWVGCLADYNHDGFVDGIDYDSFNNDFESGDPQQQIRADINFDGFVDGIDYDLFNNRFEAGC